ncbi:hypothetical protein BDU57DRAFT_509412 [Ampelomyces quisqualis]|uniref:Uncharacterized protein n=1 Tax=Ampelomyces quisqualis TaxID=50730 RepID=A0A6A5R1A9_AMPQU|nr:hypothetical protein BDU57DRAFT_509412 [Ampelomyces quisqualis]
MEGHHGLMVRRCFPVSLHGKIDGKDCGFESHWCRYIISVMLSFAEIFFALITTAWCVVEPRFSVAMWCGRFAIATSELHQRSLSARPTINFAIEFTLVDLRVFS